MTPDADFRGVEPPGWVLDGAVEAFVALEDAPTIDDRAAIGCTVIHADVPPVEIHSAVVLEP